MFAIFIREHGVCCVRSLQITHINRAVPALETAVHYVREVRVRESPSLS